MNTHLIKQLYQEIYEHPLPFAGSKEVNDISLTLLDADIAGLASRADRIAQFTQEDKAILQTCLKDLETVFPYLTEAEAAYFSRHRLVCHELVNGV